MTGWKLAAGGCLAAFLAGFAAVAQAGSPPKVVADIAPVHSLVAQVMDGVATPGLLLGAAASPHDYSMKPSDARKLAAADLVVWTGPVLTPWLRDALDALAPEAARITFAELDGVTLLPFRSGSRFNHDDPADDDHDHAGGVDGHIWLDPQNAAVLVREVAGERLLVATAGEPADQAWVNTRREDDHVVAWTP